MHNENLTYRHDQALLEGYLARPADNSKSYPLVLIAHTWAGRDEFVCRKAEALAKLGYAGFALDMFGKDVRGHSVEENSRLIEPFMQDRRLLLQRIQSALHFAKTLPCVDTARVAAMGFCFGGLCVLDLARSGADIQGMVSFHGLLHPPKNLPSPTITAKILVLHGYSDPMGKPPMAAEFQAEMERVALDWQMHSYGHTQHAFTNPRADDANLGTVYNQNADRRSWQAMQNFFQEIFS